MDEKTLRDAHAVFCETFHSDMSYEAFRHKHMDNPDLDREIPTLVHYQDGVPAGTNSFMGCVILNDGQAVFSLQSCDTAVRTAFQGRHIFTLLIQKAMLVCQERQDTVLFGFPNSNSYPGFIKLGFCEQGKLDRYDAVLRPARLLLRKVLHRAPALPLFQASDFPSGELTLSLRCPFTEEDIALMNHRPGVRFQRSLEFYQWKLDWLPEGEGAYLCARKSGRLEAFLVLRRGSDGSCLVCDWMLPENTKASGRFLREARRFLRPYCDLLEVSMVNPLGGEPAQLKSGGFFRRNTDPQPFLIYPIAQLGEKTLSQLKNLRNWSLRYIDSDTVLN